MQIAYMQKFTLVDFPGKSAAVIWTVGCNLRCPFCYNGELVLPERMEGLPRVEPEEVLEVLAARKGFLDGLAITGGEPTLHADLPDFLREVKALGMAVKLDTNGTLPDRLAPLLSQGLVDYVAMDVKAPWDRYPEFTGIPENLSDAVKESISLLSSSGVDYELRTTCVPGIGPEEVRAIAESLRGAKRYVLQPFFLPPQGKELIDPSWKERPFLSQTEVKRLAQEISRIVPCSART
jgi:pyruvate formate lyase activating enzyme